MALALGTRRSTVAAIASAAAAIALAAAVAGRSCRVTQPGPEVAVRDVLQAAKAGDRDTLFELLTPQTRARLEAEARRASDLVGGTVRYSAKDLISIGATEGIPEPTDITVLSEEGDRARVEVVSPAGRAQIDLRKIDGRWRVDVTPPGS